MKHLFSATSSALDEGAAHRCASFHWHWFAWAPWASCITTQPSATLFDTSTEPGPVLSGLWGMSDICRALLVLTRFQGLMLPKPWKWLEAWAVFAFCAGSPIGTCTAAGPLLFPRSKKVQWRDTRFCTWTEPGRATRRQKTGYLVLHNKNTHSVSSCLFCRVPTALATLLGDVLFYFK